MFIFQCQWSRSICIWKISLVSLLFLRIRLFFPGLILCAFGFVVSFGTWPRELLQLQRNCRQLSSTTTTTNYSVRPPAHNPYYVTSHSAAVQAAVAAAMPPGPAASTAGPFVDIVGHQAHQQAQSAIAVPVMPPGAGRSLHYHTHAASHALPHQQSPLTYPNWVPFSHFN